MGEVSLGSLAASVEVAISSEQLHSSPVVGTVYFSPGVTRPSVGVSTLPSRVAVVATPSVHVLLVSSTVPLVSLHSDSALGGRQGKGMDGIATLTVGQFQRVTLVALVQAVGGTNITQATTQALYASVFRPSIEGGDPLSSTMPVVADSVYDTVQTSLDPDGYNVEVEFEMATEAVSSGGSSYQLEVVVELTSGDLIPIQGRVHVTPVLSQPSNAY
jgi:hypothetical protein